VKKLIIISGDEFVRNYLESRAFAEIDDADTNFIAAETLTHRAEIESAANFLGYLDTPRHRLRAHENLLNVQMVRYSARCETFAFRLRRYRPRKQRRYRRMGWPLIAPLSGAYLRRKLGRNEQLERILKELRPDLVIAPSSATHLLDYDAALLGHELGVRTLFLIDGWDNLSSKTVFPVAPDYLAVWGEQSVEHAERIHRIPRERVFPIGTPRMDHYFHADRSALTSPYPFPYALFAGCANPVDEISALQILEQRIDKMNLGDFKIVYRPHPWRQKRSCFDRFEPERYRHVILDEPLREHYMRAERDGAASREAQRGFFLPSLDYYPGLLHNAHFTICPLSTMMVESAIFDTPVLVLAYDDGHHWTSPHNAFRYYEHFRGVEHVEGFDLCFEKAALGERFEAMAAEAAAHPGKRELRDQIRPFLSFDDRSYAARLCEVVDSIARSPA
jgi:hypothetical protein